MSTATLLNTKKNFQGKNNKLVGMEKRESNPFIKIENGINEFLFHYSSGFCCFIENLFVWDQQKI